MAESLQICRICLSVNVRMFIFKNTSVENMYKLLTQVDIDEDGKPATVCFLCHARLQQCNRLQQQAVKSNELLKQFLKGGFVHATANALLNNQYSSQNLKVSSTYYLNMDSAKCEDVLFDPKVEANNLISVKEEEITIEKEFNLTDFYEDTNYPKTFALEAIQSHSEDNQLSIAIENLCILQPTKEVENDPSPCISIQIERRDTNKEAKGMHIKFERLLEKNSFVTKTNELQKNINNDVDTGVEIKSEEEIQNIQKPIHNENTENENMNDIKMSIINLITDEFQCSKCDKEFSSQDILTDHILNCKKTTKTLPSVSHLMEANTNMNKKYRCHICTFKTYQERVMLSHLKMHSATKVFTCDICEYRCLRKYFLEVHMLTHTGDKPFPCNICEYSCANKYKLKHHMKIHNGEKPFSCRICGYKCAHKHDLKYHMTTHPDEKPFSCNICDYRCVQKYNLKIHMIKHTGEKPLSCNICEYRCVQKCQLKKHIKTHTGEKPFSCNICEYRCIQRYHLKRHIRTHTGEKPFSCNICECRFTRMPYLKAHLKKHE